MHKKPLQSGELDTESVENGVAVAEISVSVIKEQLAEIRDKSEKEKIPLSKEVEEYTRANLRKVQEKLAKGEPVYPADMEFIGKVKTWISMPAAWREKYARIEEMEAAVEVKEAKKRAIDLKQWAALMMMAGLKVKKGEEIKWIEDFFKFPGNKEIEVYRRLELMGCTGLTALPDNLYVAGVLDLAGCTGLTALPDNLQVVANLDLDGCTGLTALPDNLRVEGILFLAGCTGLTALPDNFYMEGGLDLTGCTGLTALPDNLHVEGGLDLTGCTGLTALPDNLNVGGKLFISKDAVKKIKHDAKKLKREGKIGDGIKYV